MLQSISFHFARCPGIFRMSLFLNLTSHLVCQAPPGSITKNEWQFLECISCPLCRPQPFAYVLGFFFFQNILLHFTFITATCPSEFSSDTFSPRSFSASYTQFRIGASQGVPFSLLLAFSYILAGDQREGAEWGLLIYSRLPPCLVTAGWLCPQSTATTPVRQHSCIQVSFWVLTVLFAFLFSQRGVLCLLLAPGPRVLRCFSYTLPTSV